MLYRTSVFVLCVLATIVFAQDEKSELDNLTSIALQENLQIVSSQINTKMFEQKKRINSSLPDPMFMIEGRQIPMDLSQFDQTQQVMFMIEQLFPFPGKLDKKGKKGEYAAAIQKELENAVKLDIIANVSQLYYKLAYTDMAIQINRQQLELLDAIKDISKSKYTVGKALQQDVSRIQIEKTKFESQQIALVENRANTVIKLNRLLNRQLETKIPAANLPNQVVALNLNEISTALSENNPFVKIVNLKIESSGNDIQLAKLGNKPDIKIMGGYMAMNNMDDMYMGQVSFTLPFMPWSNKDTKAQLEKSELAYNRENINARDVLDNLKSQSNELLNSLNALQERISLYEKEILPQSEQIVELSMKNYQTSTLDFLTLLSYSRELLNNRLDAQMLWNQYYQKIAELEKLIGKRI